MCWTAANMDNDSTSWYCCSVCWIHHLHACADVSNVTSRCSLSNFQQNISCLFSHMVWLAYHCFRMEGTLNEWANRGMPIIKRFTTGCRCDSPCAVSDNGEYSCVSQTIYVHLMRTPRMQPFLNAKRPLFFSFLHVIETAILCLRRIKTRAVKRKSFAPFSKINFKCRSWLEFEYDAVLLHSNV